MAAIPADNSSSFSARVQSSLVQHGLNDDHFLNLVQQTNGLLAGSIVLHALLKPEWACGDADVFVTRVQDIDQFESWAKERGFAATVRVSTNLYNEAFHARSIKCVSFRVTDNFAIQVIHVTPYNCSMKDSFQSRFWLRDQFLDSFDLSVCRVGFDGANLVAQPDTLQDIANRQMRVGTFLCPSQAKTTTGRIEKYKVRGFQVYHQEHLHQYYDSAYLTQQGLGVGQHGIVGGQALVEQTRSYLLNAERRQSALSAAWRIFRFEGSFFDGKTVTGPSLSTVCFGDMLADIPNAWLDWLEPALFEKLVTPVLKTFLPTWKVQVQVKNHALVLQDSKDGLTTHTLDKIPVEWLTDVDSVNPDRILNILLDQVLPEWLKHVQAQAHANLLQIDVFKRQLDTVNIQEDQVSQTLSDIYVKTPTMVRDFAAGDQFLENRFQEQPPQKKQRTGLE